MEEIIAFVLNSAHDGAEIDILPYHKIARHKYDKLEMNYLMPDIPVPTGKMLTDIKTIMERTGLKVSIGDRMRNGYKNCARHKSIRKNTGT